MLLLNLLKEVPRPGAVAQAYNPSTWTGSGGQIIIIGGQEFETSLGSLVRRPSLQKHLLKISWAW